MPKDKLYKEDSITNNTALFKENELSALLSFHENVIKTGYIVWYPTNEVAKVSIQAHSIINLQVPYGTVKLENLSFLLPDNEQSSLLTFFKSIIEAQKKIEYECKILIEKGGHKQQRIIKVLACPALIGSNSSLIMHLTDYTDKRKQEEEINRQKEKTEQSDKLKTAFLSNISHEIRTPMNSIIGFTELINIGGLSEQKKKDYSNIIIHRGRELLTLIDDIIEIANLETGSASIIKAESDIPKLMSELQQFFIQEKNRMGKDLIEIYLSLPPDQKLHNIYTDPGRLQQIMSILLNNSLKYTNKGYIQFGYEQKDSKNLIFFVKDTGLGISKETQKNIFNRYKFIDSTQNKNTAGAGIGLSIAKHVVELLGGKINFDSTQGQGSTFTFSIPYVTIEEGETEKEENPISLNSYNWKNKIILVVEDEEVNYKFIEAVLAETQVQLIHANNGKQALELVHSLSKIDLILMDIKMPEINGFEACIEIKKIKPRIPILAQTAYTLQEERIKCEECGFDAYMSKPLDIDELIGNINKFFSE